MSGLLIVFALLAVGKIHGQEAVVSRVINLRPSPVPAFDRRPIPQQEYSGFRTPQPPPRLYTNAPRPADRDPQISNGSDNLNLLPSTVRENQPKRKLFISSKVPNKMNQPLDTTVTLNNSEYLHSNDVYDDENFEKNRTTGHAVNPAITQKTVHVTSDNVATVKPHATNVNKNVPNNENLPEVVLDERSSFNGDPCPAGFAKVNGVCVKAD